MTLIRPLRSSLQCLHRQLLTIGYTLVTAAALLVVECIVFGAIVPRVQLRMVADPVDRSALQGTRERVAQGQIQPVGESEENSSLQITVSDTEAESVVLAVDATGTIVGAVPAESYVGRPVSAAYPDAAAVVDRALSGQEEQLFARLPDDRLGLSAPVTTEGGRIVGAILFVDQFPTEVRTFVEVVLPFILGSALVLILGARVVGTAFGFLTARRLTGRFENLTRAADAWSRSDVTFRIGDSSHDEIGRLARHLDRVSEQLENLLETRNELARDLHDSVKQQTFATAMQIGAARSLIERDTEHAAVHLDNARALVNQAQQELKTLMREMGPAALDGKGIVPALRDYLDDRSCRHDIAAEMYVCGNRETPLPVEQTRYRVAQEALANVAKRSNADVVDVSLECKASQGTSRVSQLLPARRRRPLRESRELVRGLSRTRMRPRKGDWRVLALWRHEFHLYGIRPGFQRQLTCRMAWRNLSRRLLLSTVFGDVVETDVLGSVVIGVYLIVARTTVKP